MTLQPSILEIISTVLFFTAIVHTFLVSKFEHIADQKPKKSISANIWHYLAEVEVVFGLWALVFISIFIALSGPAASIDYLD